MPSNRLRRVWLWLLGCAIVLGVGGYIAFVRPGFPTRPNQLVAPSPEGEVLAPKPGADSPVTARVDALFASVNEPKPEDAERVLFPIRSWMAERGLTEGARLSDEELRRMIQSVEDGASANSVYAGDMDAVELELREAQRLLQHKLNAAALTSGHYVMVPTSDPFNLLLALSDRFNPPEFYVTLVSTIRPTMEAVVCVLDKETGQPLNAIRDSIGEHWLKIRRAKSSR